jgi:hypothetical protein
MFPGSDAGLCTRMIAKTNAIHRKIYNIISPSNTRFYIYSNLKISACHWNFMRFVGGFARQLELNTEAFQHMQAG